MGHVSARRICAHWGEMTVGTGGAEGLGDEVRSQELLLGCHRASEEEG